MAECPIAGEFAWVRRKLRRTWLYVFAWPYLSKPPTPPKRSLSRGRLRWQNTIRPLVWQFTAGLASTVALLGAVALLIGMFASPEPLLARDEPLGMATNPRFCVHLARACGGD